MGGAVTAGGGGCGGGEAARSAAQAGVSMAAPLALRGRGACSRMQLPLLPPLPLGGGRTLRSYIRIITAINNNDDDNNE